ncbi:UNVERIFIED_ORG: hypothetical protein E4P37_17830 [Bacillus sp. AZ43]
MTYPGSDQQAPSAQPDPAAGAWAPPGAPQEQPAKSGSAKKWLGVAGTVLVVGVGGAYALTGGFGLGATEVGDCIKGAAEAATDYETVDCGSSDAEYKVVGIDDAEMTYADFEADSLEDVCTDFPATEYVLWEGDVVTEPGTIYCAAPV